MDYRCVRVTMLSTAGPAQRLKRLTSLIDATRTVRGVLYPVPVPHPGGSVQGAPALIGDVGSGS